MPDEPHLRERSGPSPQRWEPPPYLSGGWDAPTEAGNTPAVVGFSVAAVAGTLLILSFGVIAPAALPAGVIGSIYSRRGIRRIASGLTRQHGQLATAGFWIGIATVALSLVAIGLWLAFVVVPGGGGGDPAAG